MIGIDISKDTLDYCVINTLNHQKNQSGCIKNNKSAISNWLRKINLNSVEFSLEHTGHYGMLLTFLLNDNQATFYMVNPLDLKRSLGMQRGKTDTLDAYRIASYTITNKHRLKPYCLPSVELSKIKALITARERYVKILVQLKNSLKANLILNKTIDVKTILSQERKQIKAIEKSIKVFETKMQEIVNNVNELKTSYEKITKVIGIGPITAIKCITETENFTKFTNPRKFACHCGLAPFPYQSGTSVKGKTKSHYFRDKTLKAILFKASTSAIQHDPQLKKYYQKKVNDGKHKLTVINAVANKLVLRIFAVVKRDEPFVKFVA